MVLHEESEGLFVMCAFTRDQRKVAEALVAGFTVLFERLSPLIDGKTDAAAGDENQAPQLCIKNVGNGFYRVFAHTENQYLLARALCAAHRAFDDVMVPVDGELWPKKLIVYCTESDCCAEDQSRSQDAPDDQ